MSWLISKNPNDENPSSEVYKNIVSIKARRKWHQWELRNAFIAILLISYVLYKVAIEPTFLKLDRQHTPPNKRPILGIPSWFHHQRDGKNMKQGPGFWNKWLHANSLVRSGEVLHVATLSMSLPPAINSTGVPVPEWSYMFYAPLTVRAWVKLGAAVLVLLVGPKAEWHRLEATRVVLEELRTLGPSVMLFFLDDDTTRQTRDHDVMLSQVSRLYASTILSKNGHLKLNYDDDQVWLTTADVDMLVVDNKNYISSFSKERGNMVYIVSPDECCGFVKDPRQPNGYLWMYPIPFVTMTLRSWNRILRHDLEKPVTAGRIIEDLGNIFGKEKASRKVAQGVGEEWFMDQVFLSARLDDYFQSLNSSSIPSQANKTILHFIVRPIKLDRVDRANWQWPLRRGLEWATLDDITDAHLCRNGYIEATWNMMKAFFYDVFGSETMKDIMAYRKEFLRAAGLKKNPFHKEENEHM